MDKTKALQKNANTHHSSQVNIISTKEFITIKNTILNNRNKNNCNSSKQINSSNLSEVEG